MCKLFLIVTLLALSLACFAEGETTPSPVFSYTAMESPVVAMESPGFGSRIGSYFKNSNKDTGKRFDWSVLGGPFYSQTQKLLIGAGASALYKWDRSDSLLQKSSLHVMAKVSVKGMVGAEVSGMNYMKHDEYRWSYRLKFSNTPMKFWGIGYDDGINNDNEGSYKQFKVQFKPDFLFRVADNFYLGLLAHVNYTSTYDFTNRELIGDQSTKIVATGVGAVVNYDSRDNSLNAYRGQYLRIEQTLYPKFMNKYYFNSTDITFSTYHRTWSTAVLAFEYHSLFNYSGEVPWTMLALVAENYNRMRGYYEGRYRDKNIIEAQLELRQRLPRRFGVVAFVGAANVFRYFNDIQVRNTLPNYGVGGRWEFKQRVNIRIDLGFTNKNKPGVVFNINEAF